MKSLCFPIRSSERLCNELTLLFNFTLNGGAYMSDSQIEPQDVDTGDMSEAEAIMAEEERTAAIARGEIDPNDDDGEDSTKKKPVLPVYPIAERVHVDTQEELNQVIAAHSEWMEAVLHPRKDVVGGRANLSDTDLRKFDLVGINLSSADMRRANLAGLDLTSANLSAANLEGANLQGVILRNAKMRRTKLTDADLRAADLTDAILTDVDLAVAILTSEDYQKRQAKAAPKEPEVVDDDKEDSESVLASDIDSDVELEDDFLVDPNEATTGDDDTPPTLH